MPGRRQIARSEILTREGMYIYAQVEVEVQGKARVRAYYYFP